MQLSGVGSVQGSFKDNVASELGLDKQVGWGLAEMGWREQRRQRLGGPKDRARNVRRVRGGVGRRDLAHCGRLLSWWVEFTENEESWKASSRSLHRSWDLGKWVRESDGTHEKASASGVGEVMRTRLGQWPWEQRESLTVPTFLPSFHSADISHALVSASRAVAM